MVLGINEMLPRYGLWLTLDERCLDTVKGIVAEGYDFNVVYKWGCRPREIFRASEYLEHIADGGYIRRLEDEHRRSKGQAGDYMRGVFVAKDVGLVRRVNGRVVPVVV